MNITRAEAWQLHKAVNTAKGDLCRHRDRNPTGEMSEVGGPANPNRLPS